LYRESRLSQSRATPVDRQLTDLAGKLPHHGVLAEAIHSCQVRADGVHVRPDLSERKTAAGRSNEIQRHPSDRAGDDHEFVLFQREVRSQRLATDRSPAGAFTATYRKAHDPHHREHDGRNPQEVNGKTCTEKYEYQKCQQDYYHDRFPFSGARVGHRYPKQLMNDCLDFNRARSLALSPTS
jgi:hypothetical protein